MEGDLRDPGDSSDTEQHVQTRSQVDDRVRTPIQDRQQRNTRRVLGLVAAVALAVVVGVLALQVTSSGDSRTGLTDASAETAAQGTSDSSRSDDETTPVPAQVVLPDEVRFEVAEMLAMDPEIALATLNSKELTTVAQFLFEEYSGRDSDTTRMANNAPLDFYLGDVNALLEASRSGLDARVLWAIFENPLNNPVYVDIAEEFSNGEASALDKLQETLNASVSLTHLEEGSVLILSQDQNGTTLSVELVYEDAYLKFAG